MDTATIATTNRVWLAEVPGMPTGRPETVPLTSITIDLTHRCCFRCRSCIEQAGMRCLQFTSLGTDTVLRIIEGFADMGGREVLFYGGEPTMHPDFPRICMFTSHRVSTIRLITNGVYLHRPKIARALRYAGARASVIPRVSLNAATPETHATLHGVAGFFHTVVAGIRDLSSSGLPVEVSYLVENANAREIEAAYIIARDAGASRFWPRPKTGTHGVGLEPLTQDSRRAALCFLRSLNDETAGPKVTVPGWYLEYLETGTQPDTIKRYSACFYCAASRVVVGPPDPGIAWACTFWRGEGRFRIADLARAPFGSPEFERLRLATIRELTFKSDRLHVICNRDMANQVIWEELERRQTDRLHNDDTPKP